jgi:hypothetical protein
MNTPGKMHHRVATDKRRPPIYRLCKLTGRKLGSACPSSHCGNEWNGAPLQQSAQCSPDEAGRTGYKYFLHIQRIEKNECVILRRQTMQPNQMKPIPRENYRTAIDFRRDRKTGDM